MSSPTPSRDPVPAPSDCRGVPDRAAMLRAFLERDTELDGVFVSAVRTTGVFCRPTCPARKPRPENVEFFATVSEALHAGYRPCLRCRPLEPTGERPEWLRPLMDRVERDPSRRWRDADLRAMGLCPERVRRWFRRHHGMTFHAYGRARRLGLALGRIQHGSRVVDAAMDFGWDSLSGFNGAFRHVVGASPREVAAAPLVSVTRVPTPLGPMVAAASEAALCLLEFADRPMLETQLRRVRTRLGCVLVPGENPVLERAATQLADWFAGRTREIDVPLELAGTDFQLSTWEALREIPHGTTTTYAELARRIGRPSAVRAVARANGDNRLAIVVPCHRVIGSDGRLAGYGGGRWRKRWLLRHEEEVAASAARRP